MTSEIATVPADDGRFAWRLSIADVERAGPFSDFSGYRRVIAVTQGYGMRLSVAGRAPVLLTPTSDPYEFAGDAPTSCALVSGAIRDFNLIFDPALCRGAVIRRALAAAPSTYEPEGRTILVYAAGKDVAVETAGIGRRTVPAGATLILEGADEHLAMTGAGNATAFIAALEPTGQPATTEAACGEGPT